MSFAQEHCCVHVCGVKIFLPNGLRPRDEEVDLVREDDLEVHQHAEEDVDVVLEESASPKKVLQELAVLLLYRIDLITSARVPSNKGPRPGMRNKSNEWVIKYNFNEEATRNKIRSNEQRIEDKMNVQRTKKKCS